MRQTISYQAKQQSSEEHSKLHIFIGQALPGLEQPGDRVVDNLNRIIEYTKGERVLSYYKPQTRDR